MSKQRIVASVLTFGFLLWLGVLAIQKGIHFGEPWRIIITIIFMAVLLALIIENLHRE